MFMKMLTHMHMVVYTRGVSTFSGFVEMECLFSIASEESFGKVARVFLNEKHSSNAGSDSIGR